MRRQPPIAIVGIGGLFPGSVDVARFWNHVLRGTDLITDVPDTHWSVEHYYDADPKAPDKTYARRGGFLPEVPFDSLGFGVPPSLLSSTDTSQLLGLLVARVTLEDCFRGALSSADKSRVSVLLGCTSGQELFGQMASRLAHPNWRAGMLAAGIEAPLIDEAMQKISDTFVPWTESTFPGLLGNVVAGRIANRLDLGGTNAVTDAACASSFAALSMALDELVLGRADVVLTGGVDTLNDIFMHMCFSKTPALSERGDCRPFDEKADGTLLGEGLGMVALKRLDDAERDGNHIYAVVKGLGTSSDGRSKSVYAPVPEGQAKALTRAYEAAGYGPETVELVEAHGTGTKAGDIAELTGLKLAFNGSGREDRQWCAVGSVKSQIGHTKAAAGAAGLLKAALALHHKVLPPTIKVEKPNPRAELDESPFYVSARARPWVRSSSHPRRASVSSFGFGGSNFHVALEEYTGAAARAPRLSSRELELFCLSGPDVAGLQKRVAALSEKAGKGDAATSLAALARASHEAFDAGAAERLAFVASSLAQLSKKLEDAARALVSDEKKAPGLCFGSGAPAGKVAFLFPGQGSQSLDMGAALATSFAESLSAFDDADDVALGEAPLSRVIFPPPAFSDEQQAAQRTRLTRTEWAQPALGAASVAFLRALEGGLGLSADMVAGHSFGELTALHAAGVIDYPALLSLARRRGELMAEAARVPGGMAAVSGPVEKVREVLASSGSSDVVLANHNAPDQAVLSGAVAALDAVVEKMKAAGLKTRALQVATAFHSPLVAPASDGLRTFLDDVELEPARVPVFANTTARAYPADADEQRRVLAEQVRSPVLFVDEIAAMYDAGARVFVEVGPGRVLTGLVGRILDEKEHVAVSLDGGAVGLQPFFDGLARLLAAGVSLRLSWLWEGLSLEAPGVPLAADTKKPALVVQVGGANTGKPALPTPKPSVKPSAATSAVVAAPAPAPAVTPSPTAVPPPVPSSARSPAMSRAVAPAIEKPMASRDSSPHPNGAPFTSSATATSTSTSLPRAAAADAGWLTVFREGQRQTADAHAAFQRSMAEAHQAFLRAFEASSEQLSHLVAGGAGVDGTMSEESLTPGRLAPAAAPTVMSHEAVVPSAANGHANGHASPYGSGQSNGHSNGHSKGHSNGAQGDRGAPGARAPVLPAVSSMAAVAPALPSETSRPSLSLDVAALLLEVAAEKTGYPQDALTLDMSLEADLGIDSIKRVEILGTLRERLPGAPEVDALKMSQLATLGEVARYLESTMGTTTAAASSAPSAAVSRAGAAADAVAATTSATPAASVDLTAALLAVVAEKTGYPTDALAPSMSLEADLGIDSIKRVEILGALRERVPSLPEMDAMQLSQLSTLGEIAGALGAVAGNGPSGPPSTVSKSSPSHAVAPGATSGSGDDVASVFLDVVADKTGYPKDALALEMSLEADLGIDSIKRVEILGAVRQRMPALPEVDAMQLAQLSTLGEIVGALASTGGVSSSSSVAGTATAAPPVADRVDATGQGDGDVASVFLDVVADKTGYPKEALALEMSLEADLGIDSIKRVEILGAVRQRMPALPEVDAMQLAQLSTLGEIVRALASDAVSSSIAPPARADDVKDSATAGVVRAEVILVPVSAARAPLSLTGSRVIVVDGGAGISTAVVRALEARGARAELLTEATSFDGVRGIIDLGGLAPISTDVAALGVLRRSFDVARRCARALQESGGSVALYCTVQDLGGTFGLTKAPTSRALLGGLAALAKTAAQEWSGVRCKALDLDMTGLSAADAARVIVEEATGGAAAVEVGACGDERFTLVTRAAPLAGETTLDLGDRPVIVATGGARGVTAVSLEALVERCPGARLILLGRTDVDAELSAPDAALSDEAALKQALFARAKAAGESVTPAEVGARAARILAAQEVRRQLERFRQRGAEVSYVPVDVRDVKALRAALEDARRSFGPITGIVHGAGVLADKRLEDKTLEQFDLVSETKVGGLLALLEATANDPLRFLALFSSVAGRFGNVGQADYAMANEALNKLARREQARRGAACVVKSYGWGPWEGGMVTPALRKVFASRGVALLPLAEGARFFVDELSRAASGGNTEVVFGGPLTASADAELPADTSSTPAAADEDDDGVATRVDARTFGFLRDHSLRGMPVLPVVFAMELMARAAERRHPGMRVRRIHGLRVLRGVPLSGFTNGGNELKVRLLAEAPNGSGAPVRLRAEVFADGGVAPRYLALVDLGESLEQAPVAPRPPPTLAPFPVDRAAMYRDMLFHGPRFQLVDEVTGASADGIEAVVRGTRSTDWDDSSYRLDVGALDAGLQLAVLFGRIVHGAPFLPTGFERFTTHVSELPSGPMRCVTVGGAEGRDRVRLDIYFLDDEGRTLMVLHGVEAHRLLDDDAFRHKGDQEAAPAAS